MRTYVIAEAGSTWRFGQESQHLSNAREAIKIAKHCGADAVKFQWVSNPRLMEQRRKVQEGSYDILAWPERWIKFIATYCEEFEIEFMCTVFLPCDVEKLNPYVKRWKVASLEKGALDLLKAIAATEKPAIASVGADDMPFHELKRITGNPNRVLHCTAAYPAPLDQLNLKAVQYVDGYSDHSCNRLTGALAVACGAKIIEVHFKLGMTPENNPDFEHSLTYFGLEDYIKNIRMAELMLGDGIKRVMPCEEWALQHKVTA